MIFEIFPFVFGKVAMACILAVVFFWPLAVLVFGTICAYNEVLKDWRKRNRNLLLGGIFTVFVFFYASYMNFVWPNTPGNFPLTPSNGWRYLMLGFDERLALVEAEKPPLRTDGPVEIQRYMLVDWNPPKHFYVTLKNMKTGYVVENAYVSKHCNNASSLQRNVEYNLQVQTYTMSNKRGMVFYEFKNLHDAFC